MLINDDYKDIDERFWKTIEYERALYEATKLKENERDLDMINNKNSGEHRGD